MILESDLRDIHPKWAGGVPSTMHIQDGLPIPKSVRVQSFSPAEWEEFTEEWASYLKNEYITVRRFGGSGDLGIDIAGFVQKTVLKRYGTIINANDMIILSGPGRFGLRWVRSFTIHF